MLDCHKHTAYIGAMSQDFASQTPLPFLKMHGLGNDFVIIDARKGADPMTPALAKAIGDRHRGVGFDQLAVIHPSRDANVELVFWNTDGSTAGACGNATRCVAHLMFEEQPDDHVLIKTERGLLHCERAGELIRVNMGQPITDWAAIPLAREVQTTDLPLDGTPATCSMGNPHCTYFTDDISDEALTTIGPRTETDPLFPERTNVQLVQVTNRTSARVRVWERGVGVTLASGSSSCAVVVNAHRRGLMDRKATLTLDGGDIEIDWRDDGVWMTGPVQKVFSGTFDPSFLP